MIKSNSAQVVRGLPLWMQNYRLTSNSPQKNVNSLSTSPRAQKVEKVK